MNRVANVMDAARGLNRRLFLTATAAAVMSLPIERSLAADWAVSIPGRDPRSRVMLTTAAGGQPSPADSGGGSVIKATRPPEVKRWPPHRSSARHWFEKALVGYFDKQERVLILDIDERMLSLGYPPMYYVGTPDGGVAFSTPFERIDATGAPIRQDRFNIQPTSRLTFLGPKPVPRRLRAITFVLSEHRLLTGPSPKSFTKHRQALEAGVTVLGDGLLVLPITRQHRLTALIYEYYAAEGEEPRFVEHSAIPALMHLKNSGILD